MNEITNSQTPIIPIRGILRLIAEMLPFQLAAFIASTISSFGRFEDVTGKVASSQQHYLVVLKIIAFGVPVLFALISLFAISIEKQRLRHLFRIHLPILGFVVYSLIVLPFADHPDFSGKKLAVFLFGYAAFIGVVLQYLIYYREYAREECSRHLLYISVLLLLFPIIGFVIHGRGLFTNLRENICLGITHPNGLTGLTNLCLIHAAFYSYIQPPGYRFKKTESYIRLALLMYLPLLDIALFSRGGVVALIGSIIFTLVVVLKGYRYYAFYLLFGFFLLMVCSLSFLLFMHVIPPKTIINLLAHEAGGQDLVTLTNRVYVWRFMISQISIQSVLVGHGFAVMSPKIAYSTYSGQLYDAHDTYLMLFATSGVLGLAIFLWFVFECMKRIFLQRQALTYMQTAYYCILLFTLLIHASVETFFGINMGAVFSILLLLFSFPLTHGHNYESTSAAYRLQD